jgi:hypothetical protein
MELQQALIDENVASAAEVEAAAARAVLYGGDLVTNLLDLRDVDERAALRAASRAFNLPAAPSGELPYAAAAAIELLPRETAMSLGLYPFRVDGDVLTLIASRPLDPSASSRLSNSLNMQVTVRVALEARIKQALARDYAHAVEMRVQKALARLEGRAPSPSVPAESNLADGPTFSTLPQPMSIAPVGFPKQWSDAETPTEAQLSAETAPGPAVLPNHLVPNPLVPNPVLWAAQTVPDPPLVHEAPLTARSGAHALSDAPDRQRHSTRPSRMPASRRRGPYTTSDAKRDLSAADDASSILQIYFDFAVQYFDHCAALTLHSHTAHVRATLGLHGDAAQSPDARLPLASTPALREISRTGRWQLLNLGAQDPTLAAELGCNAQNYSALLPVRVRGKTAALLIGGFETTDVTLDAIGDLLGFEPLVTAALERAIVSRKTGGERVAISGALPTPSRQKARFQRPPEKQRAATLARAISTDTGSEKAELSVPKAAKT